MSVSEGDVAFIDDFLMSTMTRAAEPLRADFERREPRCRICRDETVRVLVNKLLDWHGVPIIRGGGKTHRITLTEILRGWSPSTRAVTRGTGSPTTACGSTSSVTTALPG